MKLTEEFPIYHDPTFPECVEFAQRGWDTVRVLTYVHRDSQDIEHIVVGSGYGNTHTDLIKATRAHINGGKRAMWSVDTYILYKVEQRAYFNLEDVSGNMRASIGEWSKQFIYAHVCVLEDIIRESGLEIG